MSTLAAQRARAIWLNYILDHKLIYFLGVLSVICTNFFQVLWTMSLGWVIDFFSNDHYPNFFKLETREKSFELLFITILSTSFFLALARWAWRITLARQTHHAGGRLKSWVFENVRYFKKADLDKTFTKGVLMNASTSDVNQGRFIFGFSLVAVIDVIFLGFFTLLAMLKIDVMMTLASVACLLLIPSLVKKLSDLEIDRYDQAQDFLSKFNDLASQVVSTIRLQRQTQTGKFWQKKLNTTSEEYRRIRLQAVNTSLLYTPLMGGASILSYIVLFALGIKFVFDGRISVGEFISIQGLIFLLQDPLLQLGFTISDFQKGKKSLERLSEIYDHPKEVWLVGNTASLTPSPLPEEEVLEVNNLSFAYDPSRKIIENFSLRLFKGDRLGIKGPIGSGKSTILSILAGMERAHHGEVKFKGKSFDTYDHSFLRHSIVQVSQKPFLFAASVKENICLDLKLTDEEIWTYLELASLASDVRAFPKQIETQLGEWGINLSGGQKQRLTLARALARKPELLFLDDCLSAVDSVTEEKILKNIIHFLPQTTIVWVAHRDSTLKYCHRVIDFERSLRHV
jgi:ATP-binding cassette, subfamily B, multidrug efflux pump